MKNNSVTIDDLARMVQDGFAESTRRIDKQFARVDKQYLQVHRELKAIRKELLGVVYRPEFDDLQDRVRDLEKLLTSLRKNAA